MSKESNLVYIGKITSTFGIKGDLKVYSESDFIDQRFTEGHQIILKNSSFNETVTVTNYKIHNNQILIQINNLKDINLILKYVGCDIYSLGEIEIKENEFYVDDLIGKKVYTENQLYLGIVNDVIKIPSNDILEIADGKKRLLIPFVNDHIESIDEVIIVKEREWMK